MNKQFEDEINREFGSSLKVRQWLSKHWYRWITYGCTSCWSTGCRCDHQLRTFTPDVAKLARYCYDNYYGKDFWEGS